MEGDKKKLTANELSGGLGSKGKWNIIPATQADVETSQGEPILIANVGDDTWSVAMGGLGTFHIPPSRFDKPGILKVPRIVFDSEIDIEACENVQDFSDGPWRLKPTFKTVPIDGMEVAKEIVGTAKYKHPSENLARWGVFIAEGQWPTKEEIKAAKDKLRHSYTLLVLELRDFIDPESREMITNVSDKHVRALEYVRKHGVAFA